MFRAQALKDLHSGVGMFFQPGDDQIFIGIEFACAPGSLAARLVAGFIQPFTDGLDIEPGLFGNLSRSQVQLPAQTAHFVVGFKVDHSLSSFLLQQTFDHRFERQRPLMVTDWLGFGADRRPFVQAGF